MIVLVGVPLLVVLILSLGLSGLVCWFCLHHKRLRMTRLEDHDPNMLKLPHGGDPSYGVGFVPLDHTQDVGNSSSSWVVMWLGL